MSETKKCPFCGEEIKAVAKKCKFCNTWLDGSNPEAEPEEIKQVECPACGEMVDSSQSTCPSCNEPLNIDQEFSVEDLALKGKELLNKGFKGAVKGAQGLAKNAKTLSKTKMKKSEIQSLAFKAAGVAALVGVGFWGVSLIFATPGCSSPKTVSKVKESYQSQISGMSNFLGGDSNAAAATSNSVSVQNAYEVDHSDFKGIRTYSCKAELVIQYPQPIQTWNGNSATKTVMPIIYKSSKLPFGKKEHIIEGLDADSESPAKLYNGDQPVE